MHLKGQGVIFREGCYAPYSQLKSDVINPVVLKNTVLYQKTQVFETEKVTTAKEVEEH